MDLKSTRCGRISDKDVLGECNPHEIHRDMLELVDNWSLEVQGGNSVEVRVFLSRPLTCVFAVQFAMIGQWDHIRQFGKTKN